MSSTILRGGNLVVTEQGIREGVRQVLLPLWNTWYFFSLYANASNYEAKYSVSSTDVLDRYLIAKTRDLIVLVEQDLNQFDSYSASARLRDFSDILTNWYVRRSRDRFWEGNEPAFDTLYTVLEMVTRVAAPLLPMVSEEIWRGLTGGKSVHLTSWPDASKLAYDENLVVAMDQVRVVSSVSLGLRKTNGLRVRLPLSKLTVVTQGASQLENFSSIIAEELNVKEVELVELAAASTNAFGVEKQLNVNSRALGPRLGKQVQENIQAAKSGNWELTGDKVFVNGVELLEGEYEINLVAKDESSDEKLIGILPGGGFVILNRVVTEELAAEGLARDVVRAVQQARKDADLNVSDRISTEISGVKSVLEAISAHEELVKAETLTLELKLTESDVSKNSVPVGESQQVLIAVAKL
jgi:isoleucyl-tRNA synthetase